MEVEMRWPNILSIFKEKSTPKLKNQKGSATKFQEAVVAPGETKTGTDATTLHVTLDQHNACIIISSSANNLNIPNQVTVMHWQDQGFNTISLNNMVSAAIGEKYDGISINVSVVIHANANEKLKKYITQNLKDLQFTGKIYFDKITIYEAESFSIGSDGIPKKFTNEYSISSWGNNNNNISPSVSHSTLRC
jgi:hypothetical protein